jgi:Arc/MetJ family transcription regulator
MRTNVVLNDELVREAMSYSEAPSKRALIEEALRTYVEVKAAELRVSGYRDQLAKLDQRLRGLQLSEPPTQILRRDRDR